MKVYCCFLGADSELLENHWLNKWAAKMSPVSNPKIHVELLFSSSNDGDDVLGDACSITYGSQVFLHSKRFSRRQWEFRHIPMSEESAKRVKEWCSQRVGQGFNRMGFYLSPIAPCVKPRTLYNIGLSRTPQWFCSEIVSHALNQAGVVPSLSCHPQELFERLQEKSTVDTARKVEVEF